MSDLDVMDRWVTQVLGFDIASAIKSNGKAAPPQSEVPKAAAPPVDVPKAAAPPVDIPKAAAQPAERDGKPAVSAAKLRGIWQQARDDVADQVQDLRRQIAQFDDAKLALIGEHAEAAVLGTVNVKLAALLLEEVPFDETRTKKLMSEIARSESAISGNKLIKLLDDNPFGAKLSIAATLGGALKSISASLNA